MKNTVDTDIVIVGGGISGLWLLTRLRQLGYSVLLLESGPLGGGQTIKAQGIIHGGMKYALQGILTPASQAIASMPEVWNDCLSGKGPVDLSRVPILSKHQYLWSNGTLTGKIAGFFAGLTLKGNVETLNADAYPEIFKNADFKGQVYALDEIVIDVPSLVKELVRPNQDAIFKIDSLTPEQLEFDESGKLIDITIKAGPLAPIRINAQKFIFTAGSGNEALLTKLKVKKVEMQRRPLHMVLMKTNFPYSLYAHCFGLGSTPRMTITTHKALDGKMVWYLGGQLAEEGVNRSKEEQINVAKKELSELFTWLNFSDAQFETFHIDRAEAAQPGGRRPDSSCVKEIENMVVAWPTKLAFAPQLADEIISLIQNQCIQPKFKDLRALRAWPIPSLSQPVWDELLP